MRERAQQVLPVAVLLFAAAVPLSIAAAQIALALAALAWLASPRGESARPSRALLIAAACYAAFTLASAVASDAPLASLADSKELVLFAVLLVVPCAAAKLGSARLRLALYAGAAVSAAWGLLAYAASPGGLEFRTRGPYGHYMTYGGMLMLVLVALVADLATRAPGEWREARVLARALLLPLLLAALNASYARSAWLGLATGLLMTLALAQPRLLLLVPVLLALALALAPQGMRTRLTTMADFRHDASSLERISMAEAGWRMVKDHPLLGVGPSRVSAAYPRYRSSDAPDRRPSHLHNNLTQIAAERGLPALAAWLGLLCVAGRDAWRARRGTAAKASAVAALGAIAALFVAGLFEYNFGDSEVKMLFLFLLALPCGDVTAP